MKKVLVTGAGGLLGGRLARIQSKEYSITCTHSTQAPQPGSIAMDIANRKMVFEVLSELCPHIVIHAAAATNVDRCETDKKWALAVNTYGTRNVAEISAQIEAKLIYVSTDYVFDGKKGVYKEDDEPSPINHYGFTKLKGEQFVGEICTDFVIARTSVLYGWHPIKPNFATWVIESLRKGVKISVVNDQYNSPTFVDSLAETLFRALEKDLKGIYHISGNERISRYDFAVKIADQFGLDMSLIEPIRTEDMKVWVAKRPRDSSLCVEKVEDELEIDLSSADEDLLRMKQIQPTDPLKLRMPWKV